VSAANPNIAMQNASRSTPPLRVVGEDWGGVKQSRDAFKSCGKLEQSLPGPHPTSQGRSHIRNL